MENKYLSYFQLLVPTLSLCFPSAVKILFIFVVGLQRIIESSRSFSDMPYLVISSSRRREERISTEVLQPTPDSQDVPECAVDEGLEFDYDPLSLRERDVWSKVCTGGRT